MGALDKQLRRLAEEAQRFVGDDETVRCAVLGPGRNPFLLGAGPAGYLWGRYRALVITDTSVKLLACRSDRRPNRGFAIELVSLPRDDEAVATLRDLHGLLRKVTFPGGEKIYLAKAYFPALRTALRRPPAPMRKRARP